MVSEAVELVLVASTRNCCLETMYSARVMATVSAAGGGAGGVIVSRAVLVRPPKLAEIVAEVDAVTDTVVTVNVALVAPAGTVTLPLTGTLATALLLKRVTTAPPVGAAALKVTVPVEDAGPITLVGLSASVESVTGGGGAGSETVSSAVLVRPPKEAEIVMVVDVVTEVVVTLKLAVVDPAATVTLAGTVATTVLLLERVTAVAAEGAGLPGVQWGGGDGGGGGGGRAGQPGRQGHGAKRCDDGDCSRRGPRTRRHREVGPARSSRNGYARSDPCNRRVAAGEGD